MARKRIGELLLERKVITPAQLEAGLSAQKRTRQRLGITLVQQGVLSEAQLAGALAASLGLPAVDLSKLQVDWSAVHMLRARFCENHEVFPFGIDGKGTASKRLLLAMSDPLNQAALDEVEFTTGLKVSACVATHSQVREAILRYYHKVSASAATTPASTGAPAGATVRLLPSPVHDDEPVVMGEEIISISNPLPPEAVAPPPPPKPMTPIPMGSQSGVRRPGTRLEAAVAKDLDFLFGVKGEDDETVERRLWALLRLLQKKGLITREEFLAELGEE
ncbi:MAG: general secretion pathway protein GspE [Myxococcaceae bacterium]|nr:general secretion pathway protein GspE [Myxococcaceae bacterium]